MKQKTHLHVTVSVMTLCLFCFASFGWAAPPAKGGRQQQRPGMMGQPGQGEGQQQRPGMMQQPGPGRQPMPQREDEGMFLPWEELGLSQEQQEQIQQARREFQVNTAGLQQELRFAEQDLRAEMLNETVDQAKIDNLLNQIASLKQRLSEAQTQNLLAMKSILTPEQFEHLSTLRQPVPKELRGVELTTEQRSQISSILENSKENSQTLREEIRVLKIELRDLMMTAGETDAAKLQQIQADIATKETALEKERVNTFLQIKALLTPEQLSQLQQGRTRQNRPMTKRP